MQQHVYCLGYVSFVLVMYSLPGLVLYRTRPGKLEQLTGQMKHYLFKGAAFSMGLMNYREEREEGSGRDLFQIIKPTFAQDLRNL